MSAWFVAVLAALKPARCLSVAPWVHHGVCLGILAASGWGHAATETVPDKAHAAETQRQALSYRQRNDAQDLAQEIAQHQGWSPEWVAQWLGQAQYLPNVVKLVTPSGVTTAKNWQTYRAKFVEPQRIDAGARFWQRHRAVLEQAEQRHGVPPWLVVGIIGVETFYGRHTGNFRVLDALATLSLDFPSSHPRAPERQRYFRGELEQLLVLSRQQGVRPDSWRGSYAGAMGLPQFMPSSWAQYAVDFDGDGQINLLDSPADAIGSVANYLQQHGWQKGLATHYPVHLEANRSDLATLLGPDIQPTFERQRFESLGAKLPVTPVQTETGLLALIELRNGDPTAGGNPPQFVAGTKNFYVVTRYNWSSYYAMAVIELGQAVQKQVGKTASGP